MADSQRMWADKSETQRLLEENRRLAQRYLELENSSRRQVEKLRTANDVLAKGESHIRILLENAAIGFAMLDTNMIVVAANQTLTATLGYTEEEMTGEYLGNYVYVAKLPNFTRLFGGSDEARSAQETIELVNREGALVPCRIAVSDWLDDKGESRGSFVLVFNIGEELDSIRRLREMELAVAETEKARKLFLDVVSRELRSPVTGIMGMIRMLMDADLSERQNELAGVIYSSANSLSRLVDDLVDIAKLDALDLKLEPTPVNPMQLVNSVDRMFHVRSEEKGLELGVTVGPAVPEAIMADGDRVRRVLAHLVDNAIKFTEKGRVTISLDLVGDNLRFMVSDTGPGLSAEINRDPFGERTSDSASLRRHGGVGLGLAICRRLVNLMGGKIDYESTPGRGSEFHFTLPVVIPDAKGQTLMMPPLDAMRLPPMSILLADGNPMNRRVVKAFLQYDGHNLAVVDNGLDAAERCRAGGFDVALIDLSLPKLDGMQTLLLIRDDEKATGRPKLPVVLMGSHGGTRETGYYLRNGADAMVKKPIQPVELMAAMSKATGVKPVSVARREAPGVYAAETSGGSLRRIDGTQLVNLRQVMLDEQFLGILRFFLDDAIPGIINLRDMAAAAEPDRERIAFAAGKAKGMAGYLGFTALDELLGRIIVACRDHVAAEVLRAMTGELSLVVDDTLEELKRILPEVYATLNFNA